MGNGLEITIISVLGGISVTLAILGGTGFFWLASRIDRLSETGAQSHKELNEKIDQTRSELNEKIDETRSELNDKIDQTRGELSEKIDQLREDMMRHMDQMRREIISALVSHTHPEPGGPPVFSAPPPVTLPEEQPAQNGAPAPSAAESEPAPADN